jgi:hypothetical protein
VDANDVASESLWCNLELVACTIVINVLHCCGKCGRTLWCTRREGEKKSKKSAQLSLAQKSTNYSLTLYAQNTGEMSVARMASLAFIMERQR